MSSGKNRPLGIRTRLTLWTSLVLAVSLVAGFAWVHYGLRWVLAAKNDAFLERKASELRAVLRDVGSGGSDALRAEIGREVAAYEAEGLVVVVRGPGKVFVSPETEASRELSGRMASLKLGPEPETILSGKGRYRVLRAELVPSKSVPSERGSALDLGLSLRETESTLAQFDARAAAGGLVFLGLAVVGGLLLSRQALRPVALSIHTARGLNPANLSARLPRTGAGDELDQLAATINDLLDRLGAYHAQVIRFTADASHELRSPLGAMRAAVEVALQNPRTVEAYRETLASIGEQCDRLTSLVNGLLLLARADAGELEVRREPVDLGAVVADVAEMFEPLAEERGVSLVSSPTSLVAVVGDSSRLRQLVTNLVDNAIKFTGVGGTVTVRVERDGGRVRLLVSDSGIGIPAEHLPHVFERFYQASPARTGNGYGLGLSICKWIVEAHGGTLQVESRPGSGTTFVVALPLTSLAPARSEAAIVSGNEID